MDIGEAAMARVMKMNQKSTGPARVRAISLQIIGSLLTMAMLLWAICSGYSIAKDHSKRYHEWAFQLGVLTMVFGFLFLILGVPILADLFLNLSEHLQEETGIHKAREMKTLYKAIGQIFVAVITIIILWWIIYTGFRLATEPRRGSKHYVLTISLGVVTIIFGFIYFIIGLAIIAELGLDLLGQLQQQQERKGNRHLPRLNR